MAFRCKRCQLNAIWGGALSIKCDRILCFSKEHRGAYFCPTYIGGGVLSRLYTVWIAFAGFITFAVNLYHIWVHYYICGQFLLHLWALLHSLMTFGISVFPLWSKFRTSVQVYFSQCQRKALSLRSRLHTQSTICSFQWFRWILRSRSPP